jgi:hypothetical protein
MCIDVEGKVLGGIKPCSKVYLFKTSSLNYTVVMAEISNGQSVKQACVNVSKAFKFNCLYPGKYAFVIPTSSYNGSVGSPLPYEFDCVNISLKISFQGGDPDYMVGAFSIEQPGYKNISRCRINPFLCIKKRGSLYRRCPFMDDDNIF